ncbi:hypothetical protein JCGZ_23780 [Jatropha curcas]|uniref:Wall-associated receptor kinase galacturonan-binding domain-containing protein n=1 Tax=Jatropha curcas TaxID=180498 RepID=A0A067L6J4_JATCU|nr:hypothetical protein JCGZ_23780 [Jatropha curcas]
MSSKQEENLQSKSPVQCRNFRNKPEKCLSSNFSLEGEVTDQILTPAANKKLSEGASINLKASSGTVRRSGRPNIRKNYTAVDTPLHADTNAALRSLLRKCASLRAAKSELDDEVIMLNILATLSGRKSKSNNDQCTSSCGDIHNISYPFRLNTDPTTCGNQNLQLVCENNLTVLYLDSAKYYVLSINYNNFTIRIVDALIQKDNCSSFPRHSLNQFYNQYWDTPYFRYFWPEAENYDEYKKSIVLVNCEHRILDSPLYVDAHPCINSTYYSGYWYIMLRSRSTYVRDLVDSCRVEQIVMASFLPKEAMDISYLDVHRIMSYGFEISWFRTCCDNYEENRCNLANTTEHCPGIGTATETNLLRQDVSCLLQSVRYLGRKDTDGYVGKKHSTCVFTFQGFP